MKVPPFQTHNPQSTTDFFSYEGAKELSRRIIEAWATVGVDVVPSILKTESELPTWVVRLPGLHNGLPLNG